MQVIEVHSRVHIRQFYQLARRLYEAHSVWVEPIRARMEAHFNARSNEWLRHGELKRWLIRDAENKVVGRIAAFYHKQDAHKDPFQPTGGIGFFECIDNQKIANRLFDTAKEWLKEKGMQAMDGPINCGGRNEWWGLLVDGFDKIPCFDHYYHLPYYKRLFENYGFQIYFEQYTYWAVLDISKLDRMKPMIKRVLARSDLNIRQRDLSNIPSLAKDMVHVYNESWKHRRDFVPLSIDKIQETIKALRPLLRHPLIWFAYHQKTPIGFIVMMPDINALIGDCKGRWGLLQKLWLWVRLRYYRSPRYLLGIMIGVVPRFQGSGIVHAMIHEMARQVPYYEALSLSWIGNFNPKMIHLAESVGGVRIKEHYTYRKLFDPKKTFHAHPIEN